jgi:hypothetical protein
LEMSKNGQQSVTMRETGGETVTQTVPF